MYDIFSCSINNTISQIPQNMVFSNALCTMICYRNYVYIILISIIRYIGCIIKWRYISVPKRISYLKFWSSYRLSLLTVRWLEAALAVSTGTLILWTRWRTTWVRGRGQAWLLYYNHSLRSLTPCLTPLALARPNVLCLPLYILWTNVHLFLIYSFKWFELRRF